MPRLPYDDSADRHTRLLSQGHPGFRAVTARVRREGYSDAQARRIVAAGARNASAGAKRRNPRLLRVKGA